MIQIDTEAEMESSTFITTSQTESCHLMKLKAKLPGKSLTVKVSTHESELEFNIPAKSTGKYLFDLVCGTIGLRETWYFGLQNYVLDTSGEIKLLNWLKLDKKIVSQRRNNKFLRYFFHPKFYPEDIEREVIQVSTRHFFYLEVKENLLKRSNNCSPTVGNAESPASGPPCPSPEVAILLASLSAQAEYGDWTSQEELQDEEEQMLLPGRLLRLLPARLLLQCQMSQDTANCMKACYRRHKGMTRDEAQLEYLKVAQMYRLFGVEFFSISDKHVMSCWLGVTASGIHFYPSDNKFHPRKIFSWNIIKNVSIREKKFSIKLNPRGKAPPPNPFGSTSGVSSSLPSTPVSPRIEAPIPQSPVIGAASVSINTARDSTTLSPGMLSLPPSAAAASNSPNNSTPWGDPEELAKGLVEVWLQDAEEAKTAMELCVGNHELFMRRRQPDSIEVQQMKAQAREEKARREAERLRLSRVHAEKEAALQAKAALESRCAQLEAALQKCETTTQLMAEKAQIAEEEAKIHEEQANHYGQELERCLTEYSNVVKWSSQPRNLYDINATSSNPGLPFSDETPDSPSHPVNFGTASQLHKAATRVPAVNPTDILEPAYHNQGNLAEASLLNQERLNYEREYMETRETTNKPSVTFQQEVPPPSYYNRYRETPKSVFNPASMDNINLRSLYPPNPAAFSALSQASSIQQLATEMARERRRFAYLQNEFTRQLRDTWCQLSALRGERGGVPNHFHPSVCESARFTNTPALPIWTDSPHPRSYNHLPNQFNHFPPPRSTMIPPSQSPISMSHRPSSLDRLPVHSANQNGTTTAANRTEYYRPPIPPPPFVTYSPQLGVTNRYPPNLPATVVMTKFPSAQQVWSAELNPSIPSFVGYAQS